MWSQLSTVQVVAQHLAGETSSCVASPKNNSSFLLMHIHRQSFVKSVFFCIFLNSNSISCQKCRMLKYLLSRFHQSLKAAQLLKHAASHGSLIPISDSEIHGKVMQVMQCSGNFFYFHSIGKEYRLSCEILGRQERREIPGNVENANRTRKKC